jgi:ferritin
MQLIDLCDREIRKELGDYYIVPKSRLKNIYNNLNTLREEKQKLREALQNLIEKASWKDECEAFYKERFIEWFINKEDSSYLDSVRDIMNVAVIAYDHAIMDLEDLLSGPYTKTYR